MTRGKQGLKRDIVLYCFTKLSTSYDFSHIESRLPPKNIFLKKSKGNGVLSGGTGLKQMMQNHKIRHNECSVLETQTHIVCSQKHMPENVSFC